MMQNKIKNISLKWIAPNMANLNFNFVDDESRSDIRISFEYDGCWSTIGNTCRNITAKIQPTINFGWLNQASNDDEIQSIVLHEFGHAIGLTHEFQNPIGKNWNRDQIITDLSGAPNYWSIEDIETNLLESLNKGITNSSSFDPDSIMMCPIPDKWTHLALQNGFNKDISLVDQWLIHELYP